MPRIKAPAAVVSATRKPIHYHVLLRSLLQKRFARCSLWTFLLCYLVAFLLGDALKFLFPWTITIFRACILFLSIFPVLVLRKADLHSKFIPRRNAVDVILNEIPKTRTIHILTAYLLSGMCVLYHYIHNRPDSKLNITVTRGYELPRLNERLVYLIFFMFLLSSTYSLWQRLAHRSFLRHNSIEAHTRTELINTLYLRCLIATASAICVSLIAPAIYIPIRPTIWKYSLRLARLLIRMPRSTGLPDFPFSLDLAWRTSFLAITMLVLWESTNVFFDVFISRVPACQGVLLSDASDDPSGTLITGLQNRERPFTQVTAFEELSYIANNVRNRRQHLFSKQSNGASAWARVLRAALDILVEVKGSHTKSRQPISVVASHDTPSSLVENTQEVRVKHDNIFVTNTNQKVPFNFARSGTVESENSAAAGRKQPSDISIWLGSRVESITHQSGGPLFNGGLEFQSARDLGNLRLTVLAVQSISQLIVKSSAEDHLGLVQWDIGVWLNSLCSTLRSLESYIDSASVYQSHSTMPFPHRKQIVCGQSILIKAIKQAISDIVNVFGQYLDMAGLEDSTAELCQKTWDTECARG